MAECKNIMVYVETAEGNPVKVGLEMLSPAKKLADKVTAVVIGGGVADAAKEVAKAGADQVIGFWIHQFYHHFYYMTRCT